jgi:hypothetical protein
MSDIFDDKDAIFVSTFYEEFLGFAHVTRLEDLDKINIRKLKRMHVLREIFGERDRSLAAAAGDFYFMLNQNHPDVKAIIDALDLL